MKNHYFSCPECEDTETGSPQTKPRSEAEKGVPSSSENTNKHVQTKVKPNILSVALTHLLDSRSKGFVFQSKKHCKQECRYNKIPNFFNSDLRDHPCCDSFLSVVDHFI